MVSGGNIYNEAIIKALRGENWTVDIVDFAFIEQHVQSANSDKKILLVDSLFLNELFSLSKTRLNQWYLILIVHHLESLYPPKGYSSKSYFEEQEKALLLPFDAFLTTSNYTKQYLVERGLNQKMIVIPPALNFEPTILNRSTEKLSVIIVSNLVERKGILPFLKELSLLELEKYSGQLTIDIYGTDQIELDYAQTCYDFLEANERLKQYVHFRGSVSQMKLQAAYQHANLFISCSFMESYGMALQEAVAYRLPILALEGGNIAYHINSKKNGFLTNNIKELVGQLKQLLENKNEFYQLVASAGRYCPYQDYTWKDAARQFTEQL